MSAPESTPGTIQFPLGPFQVLVRPSFWLIMALFSGLGRGASVPSAIIFVGVAFISVLFHELGHAVTGRMFGAASWIELYSFGGLTHHDRMLSRWRDVLMAAAGPGFGFVLALLAWALLPYMHPESTAERVVEKVLEINLFWGILNLLPVLPLDGGRVLSGLLGPSRRRMARYVGTGVAVIVAALSAAIQEFYLTILFGLLAFQNARDLGSQRDVRAQRPPPAEKDALARGWQALLSGDESEAGRLAHLALSGAQGQDQQNAARDLLAWVALADQNPRGALSQLERVGPPEKARRLTWALTLEGLQMLAQALPHAEAAFQVEPSETSATLLVRLLDRAGRYDDAERIAASFGWRSPALRDARLGDVALARGDHARAATLYGSAFDGGRRPIDAYNAACAHARSGQVTRAVEWLGRAMDAGFDDREQIQSDPDLAQVRTAGEIQRRLATPATPPAARGGAAR